MVARRHMVLQGGDSPQAVPGWGHADVPSITAGDMRALLRHSKSRQTARMVYAILLLHADSLGFVMARNIEIAQAADLSVRQTRDMLYRLRDAGEIECVRRGTSRLPTMWHIAGVAPRAA